MDTQSSMARISGQREPNGQISTAWLISVAVVVIVLLGVWYSNVYAPSKGSKDYAVGGPYQAIFLSNGQVYFGKVSNLDKDYVRLTNVYYLQLQQPLQSQQKQEIGNKQTQPVQPTFTLIKLGGEMHGQLDELVINRNHVLFMEGLKEDSQLVKKILE